jgi:large subunit ribosomal protein L7Ae
MVKRNYNIGNDIQPKKDLTRYVKWPKYITLQRKKQVLLKRLKVPPMVNQFSNTLNKNQACELLKLVKKYSPETTQQKKVRLQKVAEAKAAGKESDEKKPLALKYGIHQVTSLIENKEAKMVIIAHDVDPIELVVWLPTLCRKKDVPFCILKSKSRLGALVHKKNAAVVALTSVRKEDMAALETLTKTFRSQYNDNISIRRTWGGGVMGQKSQNETAKKEKAIALEQAKKMGLQA